MMFSPISTQPAWVKRHKIGEKSRIIYTVEINSSYIPYVSFNQKNNGLVGTWNEKERSIWCKGKTPKEWPHTVIMKHSVLLDLQTQSSTSEQVLEAYLSLKKKRIILRGHYSRDECKFNHRQVNHRRHTHYFYLHTYTKVTPTYCSCFWPVCRNSHS